MNERALERHEKLFPPEQMRNLVARAVAVKKENSFKMADFTSVYGADKIAEHQAELDAKTASFNQAEVTQGILLGHVLEAVILDLAKNHSWFGESSEVMQASKYDDVINGVDLITTIVDKGQPRHFEISSDLAFGYQRAMSKLGAISNRVRDRKLGKVQYFRSELLGITGQLDHVPQTVVALGPESLQKLLTLWLREPEEAQLQYAHMMMSQIEVQCMAFAQRARSEHGPSDIITQRFMNTREVVRDTIGRLDHTEMPQDRTNEALHDACHKIRERFL